MKNSPHLSLNAGATFLFVLIFLSACHAKQQPSFTALEIKHVSIGDTAQGWENDIDCILQDKNGNYWFASNGEGVYVKTKSAFKHLTTKHGLVSNFVFTVQQDANGKIWFTTRDGICCYDGKSIKDYTQIIANASFGIPTKTANGLFFNLQNGICFYDGTTFTQFAIHPFNYRPSPSDMNRPYSVYSSLTDKDGKMWFGTQSEGVCYYNGNSFVYLKEENLAGPAVRAMFQDSKGNLWFGNNGGGLYKYDGHTLTNLTEEKGLGNPAFLKGVHATPLLSLARVWAINEDTEGTLWIGTIDSGIWKYDGTNFTNYTTKDGLPDNSIWGIYKNQQGQLLFICNGKDILTFNGKTFDKFGVE